MVYRKQSVILTVLAVAVSVFVLLGVEHIRQEVKSNFSQTVSGVDLIVGARTGEINLLLYSIFHIGHATNNIRWQSYQAIANHKNVAWTIPISLGDSHRGYRVIGTTRAYFTYFKYGQGHGLRFAAGHPFKDIFDVVLGAEVAKRLGYGLNQRLVLAHGVGKNSFSLHSDNPFKVVGILAPTGTPVDNGLYVSLAGIEAIHKDWQGGVNLAPYAKADQPLNPQSLTPQSITAMMLGLTSKLATFQVQRWINNYRSEPLVAILPGVALTELWQMMGVMEKALTILAGLIFIAAILGLAAMLLASMGERKNELRVLRSIGATPGFIMALLITEALLMVATGVLLAMVALTVAISVANYFFIAELGMSLSLNFLTKANGLALVMIFISTFIISLLPAVKAYRIALKAK
jgi:putative ABC transport system permease protein